MNPWKIEDLTQLWKDDSTIDVLKADQAILQIPNLHAKYTEQWVAHTLARKAKLNTYLELKKVKTEFYGGKMSNEELKERGWEQFRFLLKGDLDTYMDADKDIIAIQSRIALHDTAIRFLEYVIKQIDNRGFHIKNWIEYCKWKEGL